MANHKLNSSHLHPMIQKVESLVARRRALANGQFPLTHAEIQRILLDDDDLFVAQDAHQRGFQIAKPDQVRIQLDGLRHQVIIVNIKKPVFAKMDSRTGYAPVDANDLVRLPPERAEALRKWAENTTQEQRRAAFAAIVASKLLNMFGDSTGTLLGNWPFARALLPSMDGPTCYGRRERQRSALRRWVDDAPEKLGRYRVDLQFTPVAQQRIRAAEAYLTGCGLLPEPSTAPREVAASIMGYEKLPVDIPLDDTLLPRVGVRAAA